MVTSKASHFTILIILYKGVQVTRFQVECHLGLRAEAFAPPPAGN